MNIVNIVHLYPNEMNTYGDRGNLLTLMRRIEWHGFRPQVHYYHVGDQLPDKVDIVIGGGGQDSAQSDIQADIQRIAGRLHDLTEKGTSMLMVCGCYQLFGHRFITKDGIEIKGIGVFDLETIGGSKRLIGNLKVENDGLGILYGFENHSGQTYLGEGQSSLGRVVRGHGNNGQDRTEGARTHNVFGTYMHGPVLPLNPAIADELIRIAVTKRFGGFTPRTIDDSIADMARVAANQRRY